MTVEDIQHISIIGAGTMGQDIAQVAALAGLKVTLYDIDTETLRSALVTIRKDIDKGVELGKTDKDKAAAALSMITTTSAFEDIEGEVVIEAAPENLTIKKEIFSKLEEHVSPQTILATNTSSIPVTQLAAGLMYPERVAGMHFFNPAHIMKLVEIITGPATSVEVATLAKELSEKMGKTAVMAKDSPGFIVNRVARHYYVESLKVLEEGVAEVEVIDALLENCGFRMGPFRLMDLIGVDTNLSVTKSMYESFHYDSKFRPSRIQQQKVDAGHYGRKSGQGFYKY